MNKKEWKEKEIAIKSSELATLQELKNRLIKEKDNAIQDIDNKINELLLHKEAIEKFK